MLASKGPVACVAYSHVSSPVLSPWVLWLRASRPRVRVCTRDGELWQSLPLGLGPVVMLGTRGAAVGGGRCSHKGQQGTHSLPALQCPWPPWATQDLSIPLLMGTHVLGPWSRFWA